MPGTKLPGQFNQKCHVAKGHGMSRNATGDVLRLMLWEAAAALSRLSLVQLQRGPLLALRSLVSEHY